MDNLPDVLVQVVAEFASDVSAIQLRLTCTRLRSILQQFPTGRQLYKKLHKKAKTSLSLRVVRPANLENALLKVCGLCHKRYSGSFNDVGVYGHPLCIREECAVRQKENLQDIKHIEWFLTQKFHIPVYRNLNFVHKKYSYIWRNKSPLIPNELVLEHFREQRSAGTISGWIAEYQEVQNKKKLEMQREHNLQRKRAREFKAKEREEQREKQARLEAVSCFLDANIETESNTTKEVILKWSGQVRNYIENSNLNSGKDVETLVKDELRRYEREEQAKAMRRQQLKDALRDQGIEEKIDYEKSFTVKNYIDAGIGNAAKLARRKAEVYFLVNHTRYLKHRKRLRRRDRRHRERVSEALFYGRGYEVSDDFLCIDSDEARKDREREAEAAVMEEIKGFPEVWPWQQTTTKIADP